MCLCVYLMLVSGRGGGGVRTQQKFFALGAACVYMMQPNCAECNSVCLLKFSLWGYYSSAGD